MARYGPPVVTRSCADPCAKLTGVDLWLCTIRFNLPHIHIDQGSGLSHFELDITGSGNGARIGLQYEGNCMWAEARPNPSPGALWDRAGCQAPTVQFEKPIKLNTHMTVGIDKVDVSTTLQLNLDDDGLPTSAVLQGTAVHFALNSIHVSIGLLPSLLVRRTTRRPHLRACKRRHVPRSRSSSCRSGARHSPPPCARSTCSPLMHWLPPPLARQLSPMTCSRVSTNAITNALNNAVKNDLTQALLKGDAVFRPLLAPPVFLPEPSDLAKEAVDWRKTRRSSWSTSSSTRRPATARSGSTGS